MNILDVVETVDVMIPCSKARGPLKSHQLTVMVGACYELPRLRPSSVEVAEAAGINHSMVLRHLPMWYNMNWRDRHAWLLLIEERIRNAKNPVDAPVLR